MEFVFEKGECDRYNKIQIKNGFIIIFGNESLNIILLKDVKRIKINYWLDETVEINHKKTRGVSKEECNRVEIELFHSKPTTLLFYKPNKNYKRLNSFIDFILTIVNPSEQANKIDDIFDFLIGQKRFEENKDSL